MIINSILCKETKTICKKIVFIIILLLLIGCIQAWARPATMQEAEKVVTGWLLNNSLPLGTPIGRLVSTVETFTNDIGEPIYYIAYLRPTGFVIVSADNLLEPIIGFSSESAFNSSLDNPLGALVIQDMNGQLAAIRANQSSQTAITALTVTASQSKWYNFISLAETYKNQISSFGLSSTSDIRVAPLIQSKWEQNNVCNKNCFNYYTPNHYPCGCVATTMAQIMLYYQYPNTAIGIHNFTINIDGRARRASTLGGNSIGGAYNWNDMPLVPDCTTTDTQRQAIGALCYDAGISVEMEYRPNGSSADALIAADALTTIFQYSNAVKGFNKGNNIGSGLIGIINPNLDAGYPVILGIWREQGGHAVICDGYGYNASTLYHHLNMGWAGKDDAWYNLPNVDAQYMYTSIISCVYNIFVSGTGEIISGLVTDKHANPISGATVTANGNGCIYQATTNANGIYALVNVPSASAYTVSVTKLGWLFPDRSVTTGTSRHGINVSGNKWQIDFDGTHAGDFDGDNDVDAADLIVFTSAWMTISDDAGWNSSCNINIPFDNYINALDFAVFANNWQLTAAK